MLYFFAALFASASFAADGAEMPGTGGIADGPPAVVELEPDRTLRVFAGTDIVTSYVSRGLLFSDRLSIQPWLEADIPVLVPDHRRVDEISLFAGSWNSIQPGSPSSGEARTGERTRLRDWFEADFYAGARAQVAEFWTTSLRFNYYTSPSDSFADIHELDWRLSYSDAHLWTEAEGFALNPSLRVAKATRNRPGRQTLYVEVGLRPGGPLAGLPGNLSVEIPLIVGFGADGQFETAEREHHLGFFQTGFNVNLPLDLLPEERGSMSFSAGVDFIVVRDRDLNFTGDRTLSVARTGVNYTF